MGSLTVEYPFSSHTKWPRDKSIITKYSEILDNGDEVFSLIEIDDVSQEELQKLLPRIRRMGVWKIQNK